MDSYLSSHLVNIVNDKTREDILRETWEDSLPCSHCSMSDICKYVKRLSKRCI